MMTGPQDERYVDLRGESSEDVVEKVNRARESFPIDWDELEPKDTETLVRMLQNAVIHRDNCNDTTFSSMVYDAQAVRLQTILLSRDDCPPKEEIQQIAWGKNP